jgi:hypothetical protein
MCRKNEQEELAKRYLKFDLPHLLQEAVGACKGARHCLSLDLMMCVATKLANKYPSSEVH